MTAIEVLRHPRARRMRLSIDPATGRVRLTVPKRAALKPALAWAEQQTAWIDAQRGRLPEARPFAPGTVLPVADHDVVIDWDETRSRRVVSEGDVLRCGGPLDTVARRVEAWLKREALQLLSAETAEFAKLAEVKVTRVAVGDPRSRWGSCASSGTIRYSWRLLFAPGWVRRATVAHEVAHRVHMDHGAAFHALVAQLLDADPKPARAWLRQHGASLHRFGRDPV